LILIRRSTVLLRMAAIAIVLQMLVWWGMTARFQEGAQESAKLAQSGGRKKTPWPSSPPVRPVYRYSVVPGGVYTIEELLEAEREDRVAAAHFAGFQKALLREEVLAKDLRAYVSYRVRNAVYWTRKPVLVRRGEKVITDGVRMLRTRCGNLISEAPEQPVASLEDPELALEMAQTPAHPLVPLSLSPPSSPWEAMPSGALLPQVPVAPAGGLFLEPVMQTLVPPAPLGTEQTPLAVTTAGLESGLAPPLSGSWAPFSGMPGWAPPTPTPTIHTENPGGYVTPVIFAPLPGTPPATIVVTITQLVYPLPLETGLNILTPVYPILPMSVPSAPGGGPEGGSGTPSGDTATSPSSTPPYPPVSVPASSAVTIPSDPPVFPPDYPPYYPDVPPPTQIGGGPFPTNPMGPPIDVPPSSPADEPVPEPGAGWLASGGLALCAVAAVMRRRRQAAARAGRRL
jgi:hypothetical protein